VVDVLIEKDKDLVVRDLQARLRKIRQKKLLRKSIFTLDEPGESNELFKKCWKFDMPKVYFAMNSRHRTYYKKGDQLFNSYGLRNNRFLLTNYGFTMRTNKYNSLGFKVFVNYQIEGALEQMKFVKIIQLKKQRLSEDLL